jgi:hypothetical protein
MGSAGVVPSQACSQTEACKARDEGLGCHGRTAQARGISIFNQAEDPMLPPRGFTVQRRNWNCCWCILV